MQNKKQNERLSDNQIREQRLQRTHFGQKQRKPARVGLQNPSQAPSVCFRPLLHVRFRRKARLQTFRRQPSGHGRFEEQGLERLSRERFKHGQQAVQSAR